MYIFDPSWVIDYTPAGTRIGQAEMMGRAKELREAIIKRCGKNAIKNIWIGGGGNVASDCRIMAIEWILQWAKWLVGVPDAERPDLSGYVELRA